MSENKNEIVKKAGKDGAEEKAVRKPTYVRCPRCELNYILKKDKLCSVCKAEVSSKKDELVDELDLELCPICKTNYIQSDEIMCASCLSERSLEKGADLENEWEDYINRDEDEVVEADEETGDMATVTELGDDDLLDVEDDEEMIFDEDDEIDDDDDDDDDDEDDDE